MRQVIEFLRTLGNWLARFFKWLLVEPKNFWITLLLPFFVGVIVCWFIPAGISNETKLIDILETRFRLTGLFLELSGIISVVYGLNKTLKLHLDKNLLRITLEWFKRCPKFLENQRVIELSEHMTAQDNCSAFITFGPNQNSAIEDRVTRLEEQFNQVSFQANRDRIFFENEFKKSSDALNAERNERESGDNQVKQDIKESAVEDAYIELMGIVWLFTGAISATASTELAKIFG